MCVSLYYIRWCVGHHIEVNNGWSERAVRRSIDNHTSLGRAHNATNQKTTTTHSCAVMLCRCGGGGVVVVAVVVVAVVDSRRRAWWRRRWWCVMLGGLSGEAAVGKPDTFVCHAAAAVLLLPAMFVCHRRYRLPSVCVCSRGPVCVWMCLPVPIADGWDAWEGLWIWMDI